VVEVFEEKCKKYKTPTATSNTALRAKERFFMNLTYLGAQI
jgi:hypothetical protein